DTSRPSATHPAMATYRRIEVIMMIGSLSLREDAACAPCTRPASPSVSDGVRVRVGGPVDRVDQRALVDRLAGEELCSALLRPAPREVIVAGRDDDHGHPHPALVEAGFPLAAPVGRPSYVQPPPPPPRGP